MRLHVTAISRPHYVNLRARHSLCGLGGSNVHLHNLDAWVLTTASSFRKHQTNKMTEL